MLASGGIPVRWSRAKSLPRLAEADAVAGVKVFHAGTKQDPQRNVVTNGGRVLGVTARAETLDAALASVYEAVGKISFDGMQYRRDIAARGSKEIDPRSPVVLA